MLRTQYSSLLLVYLFAPAAPCSYSLPVSAAPAVPLAIPFFLAISAASSGLVPGCPGSVIFSVISLFTAVGSCSFSFAGVMGSFSLYSFSGSSFLLFSVPAAPSSYSDIEYNYTRSYLAVIIEFMLLAQMYNISKRKRLTNQTFIFVPHVLRTIIFSSDLMGLSSRNINGDACFCIVFISVSSKWVCLKKLSNNLVLHKIKYRKI